MFPLKFFPNHKYAIDGKPYEQQKKKLTINNDGNFSI